MLPKVFVNPVWIRSVRSVLFLAVFPEHSERLLLLLMRTVATTAKKKSPVLINHWYPSMNTSRLAREVALSRPTAGCGQHLSAH